MIATSRDDEKRKGKFFADFRERLKKKWTFIDASLCWLLEKVSLI
jgi:hypothetical protein